MPKLKEFLETKWQGHQWLFRYTAPDTLPGMPEDRKLHLSGAVYVPVEDTVQI